MTMTERPAAVSVDELADRVFAAALGAYDILSVYLGDRLGWYDTLAARAR